MLKLTAVGSGCVADTPGTGSFMSVSDRCREIVNSYVIRLSVANRDNVRNGLLSLAIAISPECPGGYRREVECSPLWEAQGSGGQFTTL